MNVDTRRWATIAGRLVVDCAIYLIVAYSVLFTIGAWGLQDLTVLVVAVFIAFRVRDTVVPEDWP